MARWIHFCSIELVPDKARHDLYALDKGSKWCREASVVRFDQTPDEAMVANKAHFERRLQCQYWYVPSRFDLSKDFLIKVRSCLVEGFWLNEPLETVETEGFFK